MKKRFKINNKKRFFTILFFFVFVISVFCAGGYYFVKYQIGVPLNKQGTEQMFIIEKGDGLDKIADNLKENGLIRSKIWFTSYIFYKGLAARLQAGEYYLGPNLSIIQLANKIFQGDVIPGEIKITIPEGFNLKKIDARLAEAGLIGPGELAQQTQLEGYLFPDTYQFSKEMKLDEIIEIMKENFNQKLDDDLRNEIEKQEKTIEQIIIMASLIEKEVAVYEDRRVVSGIFWNRLTDSYPLQSCATIAYALGKDKWIYSVEDTKIDSPYNTYQNTGLPPGPICNPGLLSIKAAVYPEETDYNFFLSKPDGETVFSLTFEEHQANMAKYLR